MTLYLSRLQKRRDVSLDAVRALIEPPEAGRRSDADHRLLWSLFAGDPAAERDFLWRADGQGGYLVLSARPPGNAPFFEPPETRAFAPDLRAGDRLAFQLRANATKDRAGNGRGRRVDVVMDALHGVPKDQRAAQRMDLARQAAQTWLEGQGQRGGFAPDEVSVEDYSVLQMPRLPNRKGRPRFGVLDLVGTLNVNDPETFLARLGQGFGRAKAFGCGLMLIRRA
ncbi:type I-E CRISPR-associated protein Cas6/Cse3/CasE [Marivita sp. GX14005]|uniref:type I-E CRISPR-associated protein Cas6/Cse3/CasE n=1 Tax=Marivita sp. GX14005 TaxID=2942276 RepID=UPI0020191F79|nr:type I-E CRISPR-associated protein Cas6/Cse3/CasE [Marivita sp. GX14005]MCL3883006.1 type I-E CRISPR-associated protein Cas6/Cse3/CasE [Marivita sp. GX14005]